MDLHGKKLILNGNEEWYVVEAVQYDGQDYVYMVNKDNNLDSMFGVVHNGEHLTIDDIDPKLYTEEILPLFVDKFKNNN